MHWVTGNEIADGIAIVSIVLGSGDGWLMRNFEVGDLQWEINRLKNVELCHRLWLQLQRRDAQLREYDVQLQQYTNRSKAIGAPSEEARLSRSTEQAAGARVSEMKICGSEKAQQGNIRWASHIVGNNTPLPRRGD
jgi:hypothetical protein